MNDEWLRFNFRGRLVRAWWVVCESCRDIKFIFYSGKRETIKRLLEAGWTGKDTYLWKCPECSKPKEHKEAE